MNKILIFILIFIFVSTSVFSIENDFKKNYRSSFIINDKLPLNFTNYGVYSFYPNIYEEVYNVNSLYLKTSEFNNKLLMCSNSFDVLNCVKENVNLINYYESSISSPFRILLGGCDKSSDKILFEFSENLKDCIDSSENNCYCERKIDYPSKEIIDSGLIGTHFIEISDKSPNNNVYIKNNNNKAYFVNVDDFSFLNSFYEVSYGAIVDVNKKKAIDYINSRSIFKTKYVNMQNSNSIIFYKYNNSDGRNFIELINKNGDNLIDKNNNVISNVNHCKLNKTYFRFCSVDTSKIIPYSKNSKYNYTFPFVKFAIYLKDDIIPNNPLISDLSDNLYSENSVILKFTNVSDLDIYKFKIYYIEKNKYDNSNNLNLFNSIELLKSNVIFVYDIDLKRAIPNIYSVKIYSDENNFEYVNLSKNSFYYLSKTDEFLSVIELKDSIEYYLNVNSLDFSLNENKTLDFREVKPIDDLSPAVSKLIDSSVIADNYEITFKIPDLNEDGSFIKYLLIDSNTCLKSEFENLQLIENKVKPSDTFVFNVKKVLNPCLYYIITDRYNNPNKSHILFENLINVLKINN